MIATQVIIYTGFLIFLLGSVSPIRAKWDQVPGAKRWNKKHENRFNRVANRESYVPSVLSAKLTKASHRNISRRCPCAHANPTYPDASSNGPREDFDFLIDGNGAFRGWNCRV